MVAFQESYFANILRRLGDFFCSPLCHFTAYPSPPPLFAYLPQALKGEVPTFVPDLEGWNETLASASEAVVKAERYVTDDSTADPVKLEVLQKHTIEVR